MTETRLHTALAVLICLIAVAIYAVTMSGLPAFGDDGLTVAAWSLGNAHPPGFPFYLLFTKAMMFLPLGSVGIRATLASLLPAAIAAAVLSFAVADSLRGRAKPSAVIAMFVSGLLFASSRTVWGYATIPEVFGLQLCLMLIVTALLIAWRRSEDATLLYTAGALFGASLAVHHVTSLIMGVGFAALVIATLGERVLTSRALRFSIAIAVLTALTFYLYLPLRASVNPVWNWGDPDSPARFWRHITGAGAESDQPAMDFGGYLGALGRELAPVWLPIALLLAVAGLVWLARRERALFAFAVSLIAANAGWILIATVRDDRDAYVLPSVIALTFCSGFGVAWLLELVRPRLWRRVALGVALVIPVIAIVTNYPFRNRTRARVVREYAWNALRGMRPNALLITGDRNLFGPLLHLHEVERARPDIHVVGVDFLRHRWYVDSLAGRYPDLMRGVKHELEAYRALLIRQEAQPGVYAYDVLHREAVQKAQDALLLAMIARHGNAYITLDLTAADASGTIVPQTLAETYDVMPRGTLFELMPGHVMRMPDTTRIDTKAILDPAVREENVPRRLHDVYRNAFMLRGRHLAVLREFKKAIPEYETALRFKADDDEVAKELQVVRETAAK